MSNKTDLKDKSIECEAVRAAVVASCATMLTKFGELDDLIALVDEPAPSGSNLELRSPSCPSSMTMNYYPYEIQYNNGFLYVSQLGGNAGGSGDAKLTKINPKTGAVVSSYSAGTYASGNGMLGFCIEGGKAFVVNNKWSAATTEIRKIDLSTMTLDATISLGSGAARNCVSDGTNIYVSNLTTNKLQKFDIATGTVSQLYDFGSGAKPSRTAWFDGKIWVCLEDGDSIKAISTAGSLLGTISTGAGTEPNWFGQDENNLYCAYYGTHKAVKLNTSAYSVTTTYSCPTTDAPHVPFPVMGTQLWVAGTLIASGVSYIRVFDITTGSLITSLAKGPNIPSMAFDGGNVWNVSANGNYIQRTILDLVNV